LAIDPASIAVTFDAASNTATFTFPGLPGGVLPAGRYRVTLVAAGVTAGGVALDGNGDGTPGDDYVFDFFTLPGDANRDGVVNFNDLLALARNYNKSGVTLADGDFTGDGIVNFADLLILARNYNKAIPPLAGGAILSVAGDEAAEMPSLASVLEQLSAPTTPVPAPSKASAKPKTPPAPKTPSKPKPKPITVPVPVKKPPTLTRVTPKTFGSRKIG
jgi:hypothetical protein